MSHAAYAPQPSGREPELTRLLHELTEVQRLGGGSRVCLVRGTRGIGKSWLLGLFRREILARGVRVLEGRGHRGAQQAFGLFVDAIPEASSALAEAGLPERDLLELARRTAPVSGRPLTDLPGTERSHAERRLDLYDAVADLLLLAGRSAPLVVLLDDVDGADGASLELLRYVLAAATAPSPGAALQSRILWVIAFRDEDVLPPPLAEIVSRVPSAALPLGGLDLEGLRAFVSQPAQVERLLDSTGGVPERVEALLSGSPGVVGDLLHHRLALLEPASRELLELLALSRGPADLGLLDGVLTTLGTRIEGGAGAILPQLVAARLVIGVHGGRTTAYALAREHDRENLVAGLAPGRRRLLHGALGELLAAGGGADPVEIASHLLIADPKGAGYAWAVRAGDALTARLACQEAAEFYGQALEVLEDRRDGRAAALFERLFELHRGMAEHVRALGWLGRLKGALRGRPEALREVRGRAARVCLTMGRPALAERLGRQVLGGAGLNPSDPISVRAHADLAEAAWAQGRYDDALALAEGGLAALAGLPDPELAAERLTLRNTLGKIHLHRAEYGQARALFEACVDEAASHGRSREQARALNNMGVVAQRQGDRREALERYRASLDLRQGSGDKGREAFALQNIASLHHESGEFEKALEYYRRALSAFTRAQSAAQIARTACNLANLEIFLGDLEGAARLSEHAMTVAAEVGDPYLEGYAHMVRGDLARAREGRPEARRAWREALERFTRISAPRYAVETRLSLASLSVDEGDLRGARELLGEIGALLEAHALPGLLGPWHLTAGETALAAGDLEGATRAFGRAKELFLDAPDLEGPVRLYFDLGRLREAFGDLEGAELNFGRAQRLLEELAAGVPVSHRTLFLSLPRRRSVLDAATGREITPARVRRALALESPPERRREPAPEFAEMIGRDPKLRRILGLVDRLGSVSSPVLIRGESGTGKELIADAIHRRSTRRDLPLVKVNCAAMHDELLLSELFGHEKGAFTGAIAARKGRFELADGGTLFLDEIGDLSPKTQVSLLRVLQNGSFERVGGTKTLRVDVRVIGATNRNLEQMILQGTFREDLYYRLKGAMLELPPLRERTSDLPLLVEHFLHRVAVERGEGPKTVSPQVMSILAAYSWPGNIRELENVVQSLSLFAAGSILDPGDLEHHPELLASMPAEACLFPPDARVAESAAGLPDFFEMARLTGLSLKDLKHRVEVQCIRRALDEAAGNISEAARLLGMTRSRLSQIVNADDELKVLVGGR